jgi:hypothetical protein
MGEVGLLVSCEIPQICVCMNIFVTKLENQNDTQNSEKIQIDYYLQLETGFSDELV